MGIDDQGFWALVGCWTISSNWDGISIVSKFGSDDGSNSNGPKRDQVSVDGFRLDSSQSSWLMDRLGALDEEDKLSLSSSAAQVQMSDNRDDHLTPHQDQQSQQQHEPTRDNVSHLQPVHTQAPPRNQNPSGVQQAQDQMNSKKAPVHPSQQVGHQRGADLQQNTEQHGEIDSESALLLRQKIENLEHQLAEISDLTGEQRAKYVEELTQPQGRGPVGPPHLHGGEGFEEDVSFQDDEARELHGAHSQGYEPQGYNPHAQEQQYQSSDEHAQYAHTHEVQTPHSHNPHGHLDANGDGYVHETVGHSNHGNDPLTMVPDYSDHPHHNDGAHSHERGVPLGSREVQLHSDEQRGYEQQAQHDAYSSRQAGVSPEGQHLQGGHPHMQQGGQVQHAPHQQEYAELPQFLAPIQQEKKGRPAYLAVLGSVGALLVAGGIAYTYLNGGVSDVIKSDLSSVRLKEPSKLSEATDRVDGPSVKDTQVAKVSPKINLNKRFLVNPLEGTAGQNLPLNIQLPNEAGLASAFLVVRNLPDWAKLNYGRQMNGLWMVSVSQVNELEMIIPEDQPGKFAFEIDLVVNAGDAPVTKKVTADIAPYKAPEPEKIEQPEVVTPAAEEKQKVASVEADTENSELIKQPGVGVNQGPLIIDQALEEKWLERGTRLLRAGDVSAARLAFSHLAEQGSGRAALAMGMTFDPNQPSARVVSGIKLDKKRARFWYQRALSLGHEGARDPLRQLNRN